MESERCALEIVHLTKSYGKFTAVDDLSLSLQKGEFMGLLGPNGAGKTTTMKCITGMAKPSHGLIKIDGIDTARFHREALGHVGCLIETPQFYPEFTPMDILRYIGKYYGVTGKELKVRANDVLDEVRMWDLRKKKIGTLSKGEKQRIALAQALLPNPDLLILDEPTSGLDPRGMIEVREILGNLKRSRRSMLISTHIMKEVTELCDSVTIIDKGHTVLSGKVQSLVNDSLKKSGKEFSIEFRTLKVPTEAFFLDLSNTTGVQEYKQLAERSFSVSFKGSENDQSGLVDMIMKHGLGLLSMEEKGADLESLYMNLTREEGY
ncbi:MAG: ABC transporter ATP-binding protein [archaeon]|nr:ABC transporter ATP-binding protein [archaeon]